MINFLYLKEYRGIIPSSNQKNTIPPNNIDVLKLNGTSEKKLINSVIKYFL